MDCVERGWPRAERDDAGLHSFDGTPRGGPGERSLREANSVPLDSFRSAKADNSAVESTFLFCLNQREDDVATSSGSAARRLRGSMTRLQERSGEVS